MKMKIKNIAQLRAEKKRINLFVQELEDKITDDWSELKESLHIGRHSRDKLFGINGDQNGEKMNGRDLIKAVISFGIDQAATRLIDKAGTKLEKLLKKRK
ncbi:MAG TPA: hypothetical protein VLJ68_12155 [Chitinophagaceae bacterium]|nr:hypothetical protein [Chitinophagaceae bacterium]